ncbi:type II toxin-antitoxin system VapC family toxin [soil metagenome]|jgi:predicted nucleic acid-binding protein
MAELLIDTDVFIDQLRGAVRLPDAAAGAWYSVVTRAELFAGRSAREEAIRTILRPLHEVAVDREIAERAGRLRRSHSLAMPDALVAASALVHGLSLMTRNRRHFAAVDGLDLVAPG